MGRWFSSIFPAILIVLIGSTAAFAADDQPSLHGQVQRNSARIQRPEERRLPAGNKSGRDARAPLTDASFSKLPKPAPTALEGQANTDLSEDQISAPLNSGARSDKTEGKTTEAAAAPTISASKPDQSSSTANTTPATVSKNFSGGKSITIRLKRFRALAEMEVVWEAANLALKMQGKGADVTLLLDMEAVNAANRHNTMFTEFQEHRGNGSSSEKLQSVQALIRQFADAGGHVFVSERWAHYYAMDSQGSLINGVKLVSDDEIAEHLLDTGNILDY